MKQNTNVRHISLPTPELSQEVKRTVTRNRRAVARVLSGKDPRLLVVMGPCSAWPLSAVVRYGRSLAALQEELADELLFVLRVYTQKPRTNLGWKGLLQQSDPCGKPSVMRGVKTAQKLLAALAPLLPLADEALFLSETLYLEPFLSYVAIGARSSEDQLHRSFAATRHYPVGMKNPTSGDVFVAANGVLAAQSPAVFYGEGREWKSNGNSGAHLVLRGGQRPNYGAASLHAAVAAQQALGMAPRLLIDTNHANSGKDPLKQPAIVRSVLRSMSRDAVLHKAVKGFMIESFLKTGNQSIDCKKGLQRDGLSITDPVLGWEETEVLLREMAVRWSALR